MPRGGRLKVMTGKKFYCLDIPGNQYAIARFQDEEAVFVFPFKKWILNWEIPKFFIPPNDGIVPDLMGSDVGGIFCSAKLKEVIEKNKSDLDIVQWLPVAIFLKDTGDTLQYDYLHFPEPPDCLSLKHCKYLPDGSMLPPFYSSTKMKGRHIFNSSGGYETTITLVSKDMLKILEKSGCTGLSFGPANVIYDENEQASKAVVP